MPRTPKHQERNVVAHTIISKARNKQEELKRITRKDEREEDIPRAKKSGLVEQRERDELTKGLSPDEMRTVWLDRVHIYSGFPV